MNKYELAKKINELEGLTNDEKSELLKLLRSQKKYGLVWEDKPENAELKMVDEMPVLEEVTERAIISDDAEAPNHVLIEGDNLEALTALSYTHTGKIDVIYIDPPYNTGNKDFVYNDSFVDKENGYRHSMWLSFMNKRLKIAKSLLSERGVIFISMDDNEQAQLKMLCDEIFGGDNFVGTYFWKRTSTPPALSYKIRRKLEFLLCYQKSEIPKRIYSQGYVDGGDAPLLNMGNSLGVLIFPKGIVHFGVPDGEYTEKGSYKIKLLDKVVVKDGVNQNAFRAEGHFKWSQANLEREVADGTYFLIKTKQFSPRFQKAKKATKVPSNIIDDEVGVGTNEDAQKELFDLSIEFPYAKPTSLIKYVSKMPFWTDKDITILDFFAGSGTSMDATMQLNEEDGGHRKCILIQGIERDDQGNDKQICEKITYERNRRVIQGYTTPKGEKVPGLTRNNLRYYKTKFVPRDKSPKNLRNLMAHSTDMLCIHNDTYSEKPFAGKNINNKIARYFESNDGTKRMLVIYRAEAIQALVELMKQEFKNGESKENGKLMVYVFSPNGYAYDDEFEDVADYVSLCAMPDAVQNAYRRVLPKKRQAQLLEDVAEETDSEARTVEESDLFQNQTYTMAASEIKNNREGDDE